MKNKKSRSKRKKIYDKEEKEHNLEKDICKIIKQERYLYYYKKRNYHDNFDILHRILKSNGKALQYASENLKDNEEIVTEAIARDGLNLRYASKRLRYDPKLVNMAIENNGLYLQYIPESYENFLSIVEMAVTQNGNAIRFVKSMMEKKLIKLIPLPYYKQSDLTKLLKNIKMNFNEIYEFFKKHGNKKILISKIDIDVNYRVEITYKIENRTESFFLLELEKYHSIYKAALKQNEDALKYAPIFFKPTLE